MFISLEQKNKTIMETENIITEQILKLEERLLQPDVRHTPQEISELLADEFIEFGSSGRVYNKQQVIESLQNESGEQIFIKNFKTGNLAPKIMLATYIAVKKNENEGKTISSLRSSVWKLSDNQWRLVFHQGTPTVET